MHHMVRIGHAAEGLVVGGDGYEARRLVGTDLPCKILLPDQWRMAPQARILCYGGCKRIRPSDRESMISVLVEGSRS